MIILPIVRYMLLCDDVQKMDSTSKLTIVGLTTTIAWPSDQTTSLQLDKLVVLLILTDGRGRGKSRIVCYNEETGMDVFGSPEVDLSFEGKNPTGYYGVQFKLLDCLFPRPGIYLVRFYFAGQTIHEVPLAVR